MLLDSGNNAQRGEKTTPNYFYVPKSWGPESYRPIDRRAAAHCFNAAWRMAAASAVRHICLIDPESCLTNVCTCVNVWTCERVNMTLVFFIQGLTCLLFIFITHARTPWTSCTIVCKKFLLTNMSLQLRCLSSQPCGNLSFFFWLGFWGRFGDFRLSN